MSNFLSIALLLVVAVANFYETEGHGKMMTPINRSSMWRRGIWQVEANYDDNQNFCGGKTKQHRVNGGRCGPCGDDYSSPQPRANENGGIYGRGIIVEKYRSGGQILLEVDLSANHLGHYEFSVCPLRSAHDVESEECFRRYPIRLENGGYKYPIHGNIHGLHRIHGYLPPGLKCDRCVLRWHYHAGNDWGVCPDGRSATGCGPQETFRSCADIAIL